jgi:signal transduction histidine kinase
VLYGVLTILSYLLLFGVVFWSTTHYMERQIDASVAGELAEIHAAAPNESLPQLRDVVAGLIVRSPDFYYLLQDAHGKVLAGDLPATQPLLSVRQWPGSSRHRLNSFSGIRGQGRAVGDGAYLFVGLSTLQLREMEEVVVRAFLWGIALAALLAFVGGATMSLSLLRRIEAVSQTSRDIVGGDLHRRIPERGTGDEFDHLAASLNAMFDRIQTLMEGLRQVSNDIAHDLRTPLARLRQRLELALRSEAELGSGSVIQRALRDIDGILETFGALLRIAQIESGVSRAGFARLDLVEVLHTVIEVHQSAFDEGGRRLKVHIDSALRVNGDRELLTQLFANLLDNAVRHSSPNARISFGATRHDERIDVTIADDGPGIPAEFREKVLQRFFRLETSRSTPGSGLGLSLAQAIARLHDSELVLTDRHPGLCVAVSLRASTDS